MATKKSLINFFNITKYFFDIEQSTNMNDVENDKIFDPYFNLLLEISKFSKRRSLPIT